MNVPMAINCWEVVRAILASAGEIEIAINTGAVASRVVEPLIEPKVAVIVVIPAPTVMARPVELILATLPSEELQLTWLVRSCVLPSVSVPVAVNC